MGISESKKKIVIDNYFKSECDVNTSIKEAFIKGFELGLKIAPVNPQSKWIPVSEKLPEKNMMCLVAVGKLNITQMAMYSDLMQIIEHRIFYQGDFGDDSFEDITEYVKAWMPLPQAYEP